MTLAAKLSHSLGLPDDSVGARGLAVLMLGNLLMWGGFFMVVPLISLHYVDGLAWSAASVGVALGARTFTQQGFAILGGLLADRSGARRLILLGLLVRAVGFASLAWATDFPKLMLAALLSGLGGALFEAPKSAAIAALSDPSSRPRVYASLGMIGNVGMAAGSLLGAAMLKVGFELAALVSASMYALVFLGTWLYLPDVAVSEAGEVASSPFAGLGVVLRDSRFVAFTALLVGMFFMWSQFSLAMTLEGKRLAGTTDAVGWIFLVNTAASVAFQYPLVAWANRHFRPIQSLILGVVTMALALYGVAFAGSILALLGCVAVFSLGSAVASTQQQVITADLAHETARGAYFGFSALSFAFGGGIGNVLGGALHDVGVRSGVLALPWLLIGSAGLLSAVGLAVFDARLRRGR